MIRLQKVAKVYDGGIVAVRDIEMDVRRGEFVFLVGPSGVGEINLDPDVPPGREGNQGQDMGGG